MRSLIHDDVLDESDQRRGAPSVHAKYGNKVRCSVCTCQRRRVKENFPEANKWFKFYDRIIHFFNMTFHVIGIVTEKN